MKDRSIVINSLIFYKIFNGLFTGGNTRFIKYVIPEEYLINMYENITFNTVYEDELNILDIGCGDGKCLNYLSNVFFNNYNNISFIGVDSSKKLINTAIKKYWETSYRMYFMTGKIEWITYKPEYFNLVLSSFTFHHLPFNIKEKGIKEIYRVLKPGGYLMYIDYGKPHNLWSKIVMNFMRYVLPWWYEEIPSQMDNEVLTMMVDEGFVIERQTIKTVFNGSVYCVLARKG